MASVGDVDATAVTIRTRRGRLAQINTIRRASYGYDQRFEVIGAKGMLQAGNHRPTEVVASTAESVSADKPEHFFLERYRAAYALEMAHFFDAIASGKPIRTTIEDGVKALELAEAATISWREKRIVAHQFYVGKFYYRREKFASAKDRLDKISQQYPAAVKELGHEEEAAKMLVECNKHIGEGEQKPSVWTRLGF